MIGLLVLAAFAPERTCTVHHTRNDVIVTEYLGDRKCVDWKPPRTFRGVFVDCMEGQAYFDAARSLDDLRDRKDNVWFSTDRVTRFSMPLPKPRYRCEAYRVTFVGQEAKEMNRKPLEGYGHMSMAAGVVLVDDLTGVTDLGRWRR